MQKYRVLMSVVGGSFSFQRGDEVVVGETMGDGQIEARIVEKYIAAGVIEPIQATTPVEQASKSKRSVRSTAMQTPTSLPGVETGTLA